MVITYLGHSGFSVQTDEIQLVFDPVDTAFPRDDLYTYCLISHRHGDHFDRKNLEHLAESSDALIVSQDCMESLSREEACWIAPDLDDLVVQPGKTYHIHDLTIRTVPSNDEGVAFHVQTPWGNIYHAGDLNDWDWDGEPADWIAWEKEVYQKGLEELAPFGTDIAFVPFDPRLGDKMGLGLTKALEVLRPGLAVPMHFAWDQASVEAARTGLAAFAGESVRILTQRGDFFSWSKP